MLSELTIKAAKPKPKQYRLADEKGLYLLIRHSGKLWRFDYRINGDRKTLAIGKYPDISLSAARKRRDEARTMVQEGVDPSQQKQDKKQKIKDEARNTFETVAREWFGKKTPTWSARHAKTVIQRLEYNVFPVIGNRPIASITPKDILEEVLRKIEERDAIETAHRVKQICGQIFRYGIVTGKCERDVSADLKDALTSKTVKHMAAITDTKEIGGLLRAIDGYEGQLITRYALQLAALTFVRPGNYAKLNGMKLTLITPCGKYRRTRQRNAVFILCHW